MALSLLLDTHALLWWLAEPERLSPVAHAAIADGNNQVLASAASGWEILESDIQRDVTELLGTSFTPQHSDARVLDQLIYKWDHTRRILARCLTHKYTELAASGWEILESDIQRDVTELLGGGFDRFLRS